MVSVTSLIGLRLYVIVLIVTFPTSVVSVKNCPQTCDCFGMFVDCSNNGLNEIPEDLPLWVEELNLSKNPSLQFNNESLNDLPNLNSLFLDDLDLDLFPDLGAIPTLKRLSLSGNSLRKCELNWARGLPRLHELYLTKNRFRHLNLTEILFNTPLRNIDLKNNQVTTIVAAPNASFSTLTTLRLPRNQIDDDAFRNLSALFDAMPNLKTLDLNRNLLKKPQALKFKNLTNLTTLKLKQNKIEELPDGVFYGLRSLHTLRLDSNSNITEVSNGWLFEQRALKVLSLSHNNIGVIKKNAWETTQSLAVLDLKHNKLGCRHSDPSFKTLTNIQELILSHNCLTTLDKDTFGHLPKLRILDLSYNQLQWSIEDDTGVFQGLKALVSLNLAFNKIETIHEKVLHPLSSLTSLDLSGNSLKTLPENPFKNMPQLSKLYFSTSSLVCDCYLAWLPQWLATQSFNSVKASCGYPESLKDASIFRMDVSDFVCDVPPQPVISEYPKNQTALYGENMTLECVAYTGGEKPTFTWTKDQKVVEPFRVKTFMSVEEEKEGKAVYKVVSQFFVDNVTHFHGGVYQCTARNSYGPSYSPTATIIVHRFPYFTKKPVSVEVKEGGAVEIKCAASGYPVPDILLNKEGDFPAPREKRLFYSSNVYFIKPVTARDDGVYICTARNKAGSVNVTAKVSVIFTPFFVRPLYNQEATLGQSIALECQGTGYPKPKVTWFINDKQVIQDQNHVLVDNGQFLLLLKVEQKDFGSYRCELTNTLGTQRREINLTMKHGVLFPAITGLIVMIVVICVVLTSAMWVLIIYKMRKRASRADSRQDPTGRRSLNHIFQGTLAHTHQGHPDLRKGEEVQNLAPLLPPAHLHNLHHTKFEGLNNNNNTATTNSTSVAQDSGSEHSSGKDSGVGESAQRSNEDLHPNGEVKSNLRRSLIVYPDSPNGQGMKGQGPLMPQSRAASEEMRPRLSTFGLQHSDSGKSHYGYNPCYASLRRGSASRLLPVPSPVTPGMGMNSLPRHAYRAHSNSLASQAKFPNDRCSSLSRRRQPRPDTPPPTAVTDRDDKEAVPTIHFRAMSATPTGDHADKELPPHKFRETTQQPTYYTFCVPERNLSSKDSSKTSLPSSSITHLLPTR